jgi:hypothetical protein
LFNTWNELLKSDLTGGKESFEEKLNVLRNELLKENPSLNVLNRCVVKLLGNDFFKESMKECYKNHQQKLEDIKKKLNTIVTTKKKFKKALREAYCYKISSVSSSDSENISVNPESAPSRTYLDKFIGHYSNEVFLNDFDVSPLKKTLDDIYAEVTSEGFLEKYLENLYGKLSRELKSEKYSEGGIESLLKKILVGLLKKGFAKKDLSLEPTSKYPIPSVDYQLQKLHDMIHGSTSKWAVIVSMKGIEFKDGNEYKIGKVKFYDKNTYDHSKLIDAINTLSKTEEVKNEGKEWIINFFKDKIIVETEVDAYGKNGAKENGFLEISKVIDSISLWKSDVMIKEPKFEEFFEFIVLNRENENLFLRWNRDPRYVWKIKLDETIKGFLKYFDPIFNKPYDELTELEKSVANALHCYRKGNMSMDPSDKFLNYIIALESLLTTEKDRGGGKKGIISDRAIEVRWILDAFRKEYQGKIKKMYDYRSKIVHEGSMDMFNLEEEAKELGNITEMALCSVAGKIDECDTLKKFLESNEKEIRKKREDELENARKFGIGINKKIKGEGRLKKKSGEDVGKIDFIFWIKDDKKFVMTEGNIYDFKRIEGGPLSLSPSDEFIIEGKLENIEGKLVVKEMEFSDIVFELFDIANKKEMRFQVYSFDITKPPKVASRTR